MGAFDDDQRKARIRTTAQALVPFLIATVASYGFDRWGVELPVSPAVMAVPVAGFVVPLWMRFVELVSATWPGFERLVYLIPGPPEYRG